MTERMAKGQNVVWAANTCVVRVEAAVPVDISVLLLGEDHRVRTDSDFVFYNNPTGPGVSLGSNGDITLTLPAVQAVSVMCLISVDPTAAPLGSNTAPRALLSGPDQLQELEFIIAGLTTERAVLTFELYRRGNQWKVRAIGQGYTGGLAAAVADHGIEVEQPEPVAPAPALTPTPAHLVAPAPPGTTDQERLHRLIGSIFEDAARSTAGMRSATSFAKQRRDSELSEALADPATRNTAAGAAAQQQAEQRYRTLMDKAEADHRRDVNQLAAELRDLETRLPAPMVDWSASSWKHWQPPAEANLAIRAGSLSVPEAPDLRLPLMVGIPLARPLWIDSAGALHQPDPSSVDDFFIPDTPEELFASVSSRVDPLAMARALITRILATAPAGGMKLLMADLAGRGAAAESLKPLGAIGCRVFDTPVATSPDELAALLDDCVSFVDLGQMARQGGISSPEAGRLLVITNFPYGLDDAQIGKLRFLVEEGPGAGLGIIVIGDHSESEGRGPLVASLFRTFMRLPVEPDTHLGDAWTGTSWTFTPDAGPVDQQIQTSILTQISGQGR